MEQINLDFWQEELDIIPVDMKDIGDGHLNGKINARVMAFLEKRYKIPAEISLKEKKERLSRDQSALGEVLCVLKFAKRKTDIAIISIAEKELSQEELSKCKDRNDEYDRIALLFAVYAKDPVYFKYIHLIEKIHRSGFAQMVLPEKKESPKSDWDVFMTRENIQSLLDEYETRRGERNKSRCRDILPFSGRHLAFIVRGEREDYLVRDGKNLFGHRPEWIILDFEKDAKRVRISSLTTDVSLDIANRVASRFYGESCVYENEKTFTNVAVIEEFLDRVCFNDPLTLPLVEIAVKQSPLKGSPKFKISDSDSQPIGAAIKQFNEKIGDLLKSIDIIDSIKVLFKHRITLLFEQDSEDPDLFVVRYSDSRLNAVERVEFEKFLAEEFDIHVHSTEKR